MNKQYDSYMCRPTASGFFDIGGLERNGHKVLFKYGKNGNCRTLDDIKKCLQKNVEIIVDEDSVQSVQAAFKLMKGIGSSGYTKEKTHNESRIEKPEYESQFEFLSVALPTVCVFVVLMLLMLIFG